MRGARAGACLELSVLGPRIRLFEISAAEKARTIYTMKDSPRSTARRSVIGFSRAKP